MTITAALVLFAAYWFIILFLVIQATVETQGDTGDVVQGTHASAPKEEVVRKMMWRTTLITLPIWGATCGIILSGWIDLADFDIFNVIP